MQAGNNVKILKCEQCPSVVGKMGMVKSFSEDDANMVIVSFGRGRPQKNRPYMFPKSDLEVVESVAV